MILGAVEDLLGGIEAQTVEVVFSDPIAGVCDEELPDRHRIRSVEVDRVTPLVLVLVGEVRVRELAEIVARRAEMIRHDVEDHRHSDAVRGVDEPPEVVGPAVQMRRREQVDAVVPPSEPAFELRDRHHLDHRDPEPRQLRQFARGRRPRAGPRKRADVHFIQDRVFQLDTGPCVVGPAKCCRVDDLGRPVRTLGLKSRGGIGIEPRAAVDAETVSTPRVSRYDTAEVPVLIALERRSSATAIHDYVQFGCARRPHAHVRSTFANRFRANRETPTETQRTLRRRGLCHR